MVIDARSLPDRQKIETDVCIVGTGTAGLTVAREFLDKEFKVCLLESGGLEPDQKTQSLSWGENVGLPYYPLDTAAGRYFGGSTNRWHVDISGNQFGARMRPFDEIDFEERAWIPESGWPFGKDHLDPFYERAQSVCRIGPYTYDAKDWEDPEKEPSLSFTGSRVKTAIFQFVSRSPFIEYGEQIKHARNMTTYLNANAVDIETDETGRVVRQVHAACLGGNRFSVSSKVFILALGGIETPRLLLLSSQRQSCGLSNEHDLVGRYFMEHLHFWFGFYVPSKPEDLRLTALYRDIHPVKGFPVIGKIALSEETQRSERLANGCIQLIPRIVLTKSIEPYVHPAIASKGIDSLKTMRSIFRHGKMPDDVMKHLLNITTDMGGVAGAAFRKAWRKLGGPIRKRSIIYRLAHMTEQVPNPNSRVLLGDDRDCLGVRQPKLDWRITDLDEHSTIRMRAIIDEEFRRAGLGWLCTSMYRGTYLPGLHGGYHHMGTTRMHDNPKKGVVDRDCRVHGTSNLFIAGPSVFPTGGYANPILTAVALALRLADHVKQGMAV